MSEQTDVTVQENTDLRRYEASTDAGVVAGFAEYEDVGVVRIFTHTEVDDAFEGQGVGSSLARDALDDVRRRGMRLSAKCEFIKGYIEKHPEYADLED
jgi:predicted GNAT family acetyltransferase